MKEFDIEYPEILQEPEATYNVNKELNLAWEIVEQTGANLFLTGRAGTGKTTFLKKLRETTCKNMVVLAPTGVAAINASGTTLHSFFQLPFDPYLPGKGFIGNDTRYLNVSRSKKKLISSLSLLVIDEISMVRPDTLDAIDSILRRIRANSLPFGGLQLLLIGDLRQLPPVVKNDEWEILKDYYPTPYFFESHALKQAGYQTVELSEVYRQNDRKFLDILNQVRAGYIDAESLKILNSRKCRINESQEEGYIRLTTHNYRAASINNSKLSALPTAEFKFFAEVSGNFPESSYPAEMQLKLKEGAQVMFVKNDIGSVRRFYNGMIAKVVSLNEEKIMVKPAGGGDIIEVDKMEWENTRYTIDPISNSITQETTGTFRQYPLQLAWAITIHKSQGLTFDKAIIDASYSFAPGQTYVALSRCRSMDGLILENQIPLKAIITDREVNDFVAYCESNQPDGERVELLKKNYFLQLFSELFDFEPLRRSFEDFHRAVIQYVVPVYPDVDSKADEIRRMISSEISEVSKKFLNSFCNKRLEEELQKDNSQLGIRIKNGCRYFIDKLMDIESFLNSVPMNLDNAGYAETLGRLGESVGYFVALKKRIMQSMAVADFSIANYLAAKSRAIILLEKEPLRKRVVPGVHHKDKPKKEKKPKGYSVFESFKLYQEGKDLKQIAETRNLSVATIYGHFTELIIMGKLTIEEVVADGDLKVIKGILQDNPDIPYGDLKEAVGNALGNDYPGHIISMCRKVFQHELNSKSEPRV